MIILASASPRRRELLKTVVDDFEIITTDIDEEKSYILPPLEAVIDIAKRKGLEVRKDHPNDIIISADTIVLLGDQIIGKPKIYNTPRVPQITSVILFDFSLK